MNLIIDIGNTRIKTALFEKDELKHFFVFESYPNEPNSIKQKDIGSHLPEGAIRNFLEADLFGTYTIKKCIIASVLANSETFVNRINEKVKTLVFTSETPTPLLNLYRSVKTLGPDRLAAAVGGAFIFPNMNILVIDAGTCIKYNFVTNKNEYIGGGISPGLKMRFKALNSFTSQLPLLDVHENFDTLIGADSKESMLSGVEIGAVAEVEGFINRYKQIYPDINVVLTGGDANFFEKRLKSRIFTDSFLILKGLNLILEHNFNGK